MKLTVQNLSNTKVTLNSRLGTLMPHQTKEFLVTVEDIEKLAGRLQALEMSGSVAWATEVSIVQDDRSEGATVAIAAKGGDLVLPIKDSQTGTTEKLVASIWIEGNRYINTSNTKAMIGGSTIAQGATLRIRPFSDPLTTLCHFVATNSTLSSQNIVESGVGGNLLVENSDWYEIYLSGNDPADTALVTGLYLNILGG